MECTKINSKKGSKTVDSNLILTKRSCKNCIYATKAVDKDVSISVCANRYGFNGTLFIPREEDWCGNFQRPFKVDRPTLKASSKGRIRYIALTKGKVAIVDSEDYAFLNQVKWYASESGRSFYAYRRNSRGTVAMHRLIMNAPQDKLVDHKDGNGLNNRRNNLRLCDRSENAFNRRIIEGISRYKGVYFNRRNKRWCAQIAFRKKRFFIGTFDSEIEAARAYDKRAEELCGEFAFLNFSK